MRRIAIAILLLADASIGHAQIAPPPVGPNIAVPGNITAGGLISSTNNTTPAGPTNSGVALSAAPDVADALFFDATQSVNNRTYEVLAFQGGLNFRFKNDAGNSALTWLKASGGQAAGITGITSNSGTGAWAHTGNFGVVNSAAGAPASLGSSVQMFTSGNVSTVAHVNSLNTANSRIFYAQWDNNYTYSLGFANDAFNSFVPALQIQGGAGFGISGIQSNSGSGQWLHSGGFQVNGTVTANTYNGNGIVQTGSAPGGIPTISTTGVDTNVSLTITTKGAGGITLDRDTNVTGTLSSTGNMSAGGTFKASGGEQLQTFLTAAIPNCSGGSTGLMVAVEDVGGTPAWNATLPAGTGTPAAATTFPVFCDGTNWRIH